MAKRTAPHPGTANHSKPDANVPAPASNYTWLWTLGAILVFTAVLYWPSLQNGFTNWDDDVYVTANENLSWNAENLKVLSTKQVAGNFHPLTMWSLAWDRGSDAGKAPAPYPFHRSNLLLHLLNTALVFWLVRRLRVGTAIAAITALFFAIHPMHVESVAWVSGRKDVLFSAFFLGGLITFTYNLERQKIGLWLLTFGLFVLSCLAKPAAIVFPLVLLLLHWYLQPDTVRKPRNLAYLLPFLLVSAVFSYTTLLYQKEIGAVDEQFGFLTRSLFAGYAFAAYLWKMILPFNLSAFHPAPLANEKLPGLFYAATLASLVIIALMVFAFQRWRLVFFALAFYLLQVLLVLGFIKVGSAVTAERYTYLSYTGLFVLLGYSVLEVSKKSALWRALAWGSIAVLAVFWALTTRKQIAVWRNSESLWSQIVAQYPTEKCLSYRGYDRYLGQKWDQALEDFDRAYALNPNNETTVHIRAICLDKSGKKEAALKVYEEYEQKFPPKADIFFQHATLLNGLKRTAEAIPPFEKGLSLNPDNIDAWTNLATAYFAQQQPQKAEECCNKALAINPKFLIALNNRGALRLSMGRYEEAIADLSASLAINPNQPQTYNYRSICYERTGKKAEAAADKAAMGNMQR